ncbi:hypothetical protein B0J18DRAFT_407678 [Chaetomium sp. MPI-SDFR-AT-0129]|nr:hypothetical protein B0J18DRAFT_407678 [Chaetomium sp. MPI-SDFR-AT-0129]
MASFLSGLLLLGAAVSPARASMAAWWTDIGPQLLVLNETTNQIRYSACNSRAQPLYSNTDGHVLPIAYKPKPGTPVTGVGWWNGRYTEASISYINADGNIANTDVICDMNTGLFKSKGNWIISTDAPSVHPNTGLAALVLGETTGYRVYYHDDDGAVNELQYLDNTWRYRGIVSHDINNLPVLAAAFSGADNITVVSPRDDQNLAAARWMRDQSWNRTTLPHPLKGGFVNQDAARDTISIDQAAPADFSLDAWDGKTKGLGITIDSAYTRSIFYIGNDSSLHQVANQHYVWGQRASQSNAFWPKADDVNGDLAATYNFGTSDVRLYYTVNGRISEISFENGNWVAYSALQAPPPQPTQTAVPTPTPSTLQTESDSDGGLSTGAKAGIGVGVSLGAIALGAIIAVVVLAQRKKRRGFEVPPETDEGSTTLGPDTPAPSYGSPALARASAAQYDQYGWDQKGSPTHPYPPTMDQVSQIDGTNRVEMDTAMRAEMDTTIRPELYVPPPQPIYELPQGSYSHELVAVHPAPPEAHQPPQQQH